MDVTTTKSEAFSRDLITLTRACCITAARKKAHTVFSYLISKLLLLFFIVCYSGALTSGWCRSCALCGCR